MSSFSVTAIAASHYIKLSARQSGPPTDVSGLGDHGVESLPQRLPVCNSEKTPSNTSTKDLDYMFVTRERHSERERERELALSAMPMWLQEARSNGAPPGFNVRYTVTHKHKDRITQHNTYVHKYVHICHVQIYK